MTAATELHQLGQSLWLDNISRDLLDRGTLAQYVKDYCVSGLTSNPTIFDQAIRNTDAYDAAIRHKANLGLFGKSLFFELALEDLAQAAALFRPIHTATGGVDGWVSLEVSPLLADDTEATIDEAARLHSDANLPNLYIKIPGTAAGIRAIETSIFNGIPINVTLLFSRQQYLDAAHAYARGIQRRLLAGLDPKVGSVASLFVSRWDKAIVGKVPQQMQNRLGLAIAGQTYCAYRQWLADPVWRQLAAMGALPQRLLWASTGTKDPALPQTYYVEALAAPDTVDTMPEATLRALAVQETLHAFLQDDGRDAERVLAEFEQAGIDTTALAAQLQQEGAQAFISSWNDLMAVVADKIVQLNRTPPSPGSAPR